MNKLSEIVKHKLLERKFFTPNKNKFKKTFQTKKAKIIWEIKLLSPNWVNINKEKLNEIIKFYSNNSQIIAISVLIDEKYFWWDISRAKSIKDISNKTILFKEFVVSKSQIDWANYYWYDAILLIKKILDNRKLIEFINYSNEKNIHPIVEVDNEKDFKYILNLSKKYDFSLAINARNLNTMEINTEIHFYLYEKYKTKLQDKIIFAFSWIDIKDIYKYKNKFNWVLIWTNFMKNFN